MILLGLLALLYIQKTYLFQSLMTLQLLVDFQSIKYIYFIKTCRGIDIRGIFMTKQELTTTVKKKFKSAKFF